MNEPLYELTVNFKGLTDDVVRVLQEWIISSPETAPMVYWMSKAVQEDDGEMERTGHWETVEYEIQRGETETRYRCSKCGGLQYAMSNYCPDCGARMEASEDAVKER